MAKTKTAAVIASLYRYSISICRCGPCIGCIACVAKIYIKKITAHGIYMLCVIRSLSLSFSRLEHSLPWQFNTYYSQILYYFLLFSINVISLKSPSTQHTHKQTARTHTDAFMKSNTHTQPVLSVCFFLVTRKTQHLINSFVCRKHLFADFSLIFFVIFSLSMKFKLLLYNHLPPLTSNANFNNATKMLVECWWWAQQ